MRLSFIAWERYERRSDLLAQHLGATMHHIYVGQRGSVLRAPGRYVRQAWQTWRVLQQERPDVVLVQNPPIFCALVAYLYARQRRAGYVIDSHSAMFLSPKWRWSLWLHRRLSRRAIATIAHNQPQARLVEGWGCPSCRISFVPGAYAAGTPPARRAPFEIVVISTFGEDEPTGEIVEAARRLPNVQFYITGDVERAGPTLPVHKPANVEFTGYLPNEQYVGLLRGVDAIMDLTTRDDTLLSGGFEAVSLGTPMIISDWKVLRDYFSAGAVYVGNTAASIYEGVLRAQREQAALRLGIGQLQATLNREWESEFAALQRLLSEYESSRRRTARVEPAAAPSRRKPERVA